MNQFRRRLFPSLCVSLADFRRVFSQVLKSSQISLRIFREVLKGSRISLRIFRGVLKSSQISQISQILKKSQNGMNLFVTVYRVAVI